MKIVTKATLKRVAHLLPLKNIDIVLYENPEGAIAEVGGIGGYTPNAHTVLISLDPKNPKFKSAITRELSSTLAHELHHAIRWRKPGYGITLLEALVTEGLADHFALEAGSRKPPPWSRALSVTERKRLLKRAHRLFHHTYNHMDWFFGSKKKRIPRWTGYSLGFYLVGEYLKSHPNTKASSLVTTKASVIIGV